MREERREEGVGRRGARVHPRRIRVGQKVRRRRQVEEETGTEARIPFVICGLEPEESRTRSDAADGCEQRRTGLQRQQEEAPVERPSPAGVGERVGACGVGVERAAGPSLPPLCLQLEELVDGCRVGASIVALHEAVELLGEPSAAAFRFAPAASADLRGPAVAKCLFSQEDRAIPPARRGDGEGEVSACVLPRLGDTPTRLPAIDGDERSLPAAMRADVAALQRRQERGDGLMRTRGIDERGAKHHEDRDCLVLGATGQGGQGELSPAIDRAGERAEQHVIAVGDLQQGQSAPRGEVPRGPEQRFGFEHRVGFQGARRQGAPLALLGLGDLPQPRESYIHLRWRSVLVSSLVSLMMCSLLVISPMVVSAGRGSSVAGASPSSAMLHPVVVQSRTVALNGRVATAGIDGPRTLHARFRRRSRPGTLLVAAVIDGVKSSGMSQPRWSIPGWRRGAGMIGGQLATTGRPATGGLQSMILFDADNPGGVRSIRIGRVPVGTVAWVTVVLAELAGVPRHLEVIARGGSTNGPTPSDYTTQSSVTTAAPVGRAPDLVLASFTNGGTAPHGEQFVLSHGWRVLGADRERNGVDQPILFDERVWRAGSRPREWMRYLGGNPIDNCAAIVALG